MKNQRLTLILLACLALAGIAFAQSVTERLVRIQSEVPSGDVTAFFEKSVTIAGETFPRPWESVSWNASDKQVTVNGQTMTYSQVMAFVVAIAEQERAEQAAAAASPTQ